MHEVGLVDGIVGAVLNRAGARPVAGVRVRIGALHRAHRGPMDLAWEMASLGSSLEGSRLDLVEVPVATTCRACGRVDESPDRVPYCAACGSTEVDHAGGDELLLESIEYRPAGDGPGVEPEPAAADRYR